MRITAKGQITIPSEIRDQLGFTPHSEVVLEVEGNTVRIRRSSPAGQQVKAERRSLKDEPFVGIWRDRQDMVDSSEWVRTIRQREWTRR